MLEATNPILHWLENTPFATSVAASDWAFPLAEAVHVISLTLVLGTVCIVDLRLLGWASVRRPYAELAHEVLPWTWGAFCLAVLSGSMMFISQASEYYENTAFRIKMMLVLLAGINMLIFELITARGAARWNANKAIPWPGRFAGAISLVLWICVVFFGRRIGFTMLPSQ